VQRDEAHLVGAADEVQVVPAQELGHHVLTEGEGHAAVVLAPAYDVLVGVGPQQVAQQTRVRDICEMREAGRDGESQ
jgi:hypothetical protein